MTSKKIKLELIMLVKDVNIKTLVTGDKSAWLKLETLYPDDVVKLGQLADVQEVKITISNE